jgi:uncharacterized RDD family membrane protein YckC
MEVVTVNNTYSSGLRRLGAFIIDRIALWPLFSLFFWRWWSPFDYDFDVIHWGWHIWGFHVMHETIFILYFSLMESSRYQGTLGKIALGIKVVDHNNQRLEFPRALLRNLSKILSGFLLGLGYIMIIFDDRKQGLHDKIADTFVVKA